MVALIPRSGSGSPCEATSNEPGLGEALCVLKDTCLSKMFQMGEVAQCSENKKKKKNGGAERRTRACRPSEGLGGECEDHEDEPE